MAKTAYVSFKPHGMETAVWNEIITSWENGLSDREAAFRASRYSDVKIAESDIQELLASSPQIADLKEFLLCSLTSQAKINVKDSIDSGNMTTTRWFLERKVPEEFSSKAAVAFEHTVVGASMDEKAEELKKLFEDFGAKPKEDADGEGEV